MAVLFQNITAMNNEHEDHREILTMSAVVAETKSEVSLHPENLNSKTLNHQRSFMSQMNCNFPDFQLNFSQTVSSFVILHLCL